MSNHNFSLAVLVQSHLERLTQPGFAIHLHKSRLYILEATAPAGTPPPGYFQQFLSILDENGERIRYNLDADGVRTKVD